MVNDFLKILLLEDEIKDAEISANLNDVLQKMMHYRRKKNVQDSSSQRELSPSPQLFDNLDQGFLRQYGNSLASDRLPETQKDYSSAKSFQRITRRIGRIISRYT